MKLDFSQIWPYRDLLVSGAINSLIIMSVTACIGLLLAVVLAELRRSGPVWTQWLVAAYVEAIRDTPFIVQLFFIYFGLPAAGIRLDAWSAAGIALTLNITAYFIEIIRAGLEATPSGQVEAARALGLRRWQIFRKIVLPPALGRVYAPLVSQFVLVFLGSAVISQISAEDLTFQAQFIQSRSFRAFEAFILATLIYVGMTFVLRMALMRLGPVWFPWSRLGR